MFYRGPITIFLFILTFTANGSHCLYLSSSGKLRCLISDTYSCSDYLKHKKEFLKKDYRSCFPFIEVIPVHQLEALDRIVFAKEGVTNIKEMRQKNHVVLTNDKVKEIKLKDFSLQLFYNEYLKYHKMSNEVMQEEGVETKGFLTYIESKKQGKIKGFLSFVQEPGFQSEVEKRLHSDLKMYLLIIKNLEKKITIEKKDGFIKAYNLLVNITNRLYNERMFYLNDDNYKLLGQEELPADVAINIHDYFDDSENKNNFKLVVKDLLNLKNEDHSLYERWIEKLFSIAIKKEHKQDYLRNDLTFAKIMMNSVFACYEDSLDFSHLFLAKKGSTIAMEVDETLVQNRINKLSLDFITFLNQQLQNHKIPSIVLDLFKIVYLDLYERDLPLLENKNNLDNQVSSIFYLLYVNPKVAQIEVRRGNDPKFKVQLNPITKRSMALSVGKTVQSLMNVNSDSKLNEDESLTSIRDLFILNFVDKLK